MVVLVMVGLGTALLMQRLTREQARAHSMRNEAARLAELDRLRTGFIALVSHDLRTPLTATRAGLGLLETSAADRLEPAERRLLGNARRNTERLSLQIDDLLVANQLDAGTLRLDREPLDLRVVATDTLSAVHPLLHEKGQSVAIDLPEPLLTEGDPRRLEQAAVNILANAYRHTPAGTRIGISGRAVDDEVVLSVRDDGPGIPRDQVDRIFQRFVRLTAAGDGTGLGLPAARGLIELHGGRLWAESEPGQGAVFHIALPSLSEEAAR